MIRTIRAALFLLPGLLSTWLSFFILSKLDLSPLCDERYFPSPRQHFVMLAFDAWWKECVFENENTQHRLTRRDLVLAVTNKDGGAHFDTEVEERYDQFRKSWSGGSSLVGRRSGTKRGYDNIPIYPAIRQVAYELLHSGIDAQLSQETPSK